MQAYKWQRLDACWTCVSLPWQTSKRDKNNGTATPTKILIWRIISADNFLSVIYKYRVFCDIMQHFMLLWRKYLFLTLVGVPSKYNLNWRKRYFKYSLIYSRMSHLEPCAFPEYSFSVLPLVNIKAQGYSHKPPECVRASFGPLTDGEEEDKRSCRPLPSVWFN